MNDGTSTTGATGTTEMAEQKAKDVAASTAEQARDVADVAMEQAQAVAGDAASQVRHVTQRTKAELKTQADERAAQMSQTLREAARQMQKMADNSGESGMVVDLSRDAGQRIEALAQRIEHGGVDRIVADVKAAARRRPGTFLLGAMAAGFAVGRLVRDAQAAEPDRHGDLPQPDGAYRIPEPRDFLASDPTFGSTPGSMTPPEPTIGSGTTGVPGSGTTGVPGSGTGMGSGLADRPLGSESRTGGLG